MGVGEPVTTEINQHSGDGVNEVSNSNVTKAAYEQNLDLEKFFPIQSSCKSDNTNMKGIQRVIKNLQNDIERIKRFSNINSAFDALTKEDVEPWKSIKKVLNSASLDISGYFKNILGGVRGFVLLEVQKEAKKLMPFLFPGEVPSFIDKLNQGINIISCAFAKILRGLISTVSNLLGQLIDKYINGPMCLAEDFVSNLLKKILDPITSAINSALSLIKGTLPNITNNLANALDFVTGILNFFKCDDDKKCPTVDEISLQGFAIKGGDNFINPSYQYDIAKSYTTGIGNGNSSAAINVAISNFVVKPQ